MPSPDCHNTRKTMSEVHVEVVMPSSEVFLCKHNAINEREDSSIDDTSSVGDDKNEFLIDSDSDCHSLYGDDDDDDDEDDDDDISVLTSDDEIDCHPLLTSSSASSKISGGSSVDDNATSITTATTASYSAGFTFQFSSDSRFVADALQKRDQQEHIRTAKAMLLEAYSNEVGSSNLYSNKHNCDIGDGKQTSPESKRRKF